MQCDAMRLAIDVIRGRQDITIGNPVMVSVPKSYGVQVRSVWATRDGRIVSALKNSSGKLYDVRQEA